MAHRLFSSITSRGKQFIQDVKHWNNVLPALLRQTNHRRWHRVAVSGPPPWDERNKVIVSFIKTNSSVIDLGCGAQTLRSYLPENCRYQPCDLVQSTSDVIVCDFNKSEFPNAATIYDYAVCSGVLEYIVDHKRFLIDCCSVAQSIILSYNPLMSGNSTIKRLKNSWINHFSRIELESLFRELSIEAKCLYVSKHGELIYALKRSYH